MIHMGKQVRECLDSQDRTVTWLSKQLGCTRMNAYKIFLRESLEVELLYRISMVLSYNFFKDLSDQFVKDSRNTKESKDR